jgi:hypothetical protein
MMGTQRSQSTRGTPPVFMRSKPAQESNQRKIVNQTSRDAVDCE